MKKFSVDLEKIHDFCLNLRRVQRELLARDLFLESACILSAIHRIAALADCHDAGRRPFEPVSIQDLAIPERLRRHALDHTTQGHTDLILEAARLIENLDKRLWRLPPARVTQSHLTPIQKAALLHDVWPSDANRVMASLREKGYFDRSGQRTRPALTFVWRVMEHELDAIHAEHMRQGCPILRMDSELIQILRSDPQLRLRAWQDTGMIVEDTLTPHRPKAILHPFYAWQIRVEKSAGLFLRENAAIDWLRSTPQPTLDAVAA
jgi:hypothetical protein